MEAVETTLVQSLRRLETHPDLVRHYPLSLDHLFLIDRELVLEKSR